MKSYLALCFVVLTLTVIFPPTMSSAQNSKRTVLLTDSSIVRGIIIAQNDTILVLDIGYGLLRIPMTSVVSLTDTVAYQGAPAYDAQATMRPGHFPSMRGSEMISGSASVSFQQPKGSFESTVNIQFNPTLVRFVTTGLGLGAGLTLGYTGASSESISDLGFGPRIMGVFGSSESRSRPFIKVGFTYLAMNVSHGSFRFDYEPYRSTNFNGTMLSFSIGVLSTPTANIGIPLEVTVDAISFNGTSTTVIGLSLGIAGFAY